MVAQASIDLEGFGTLNFAELHGPAWSILGGPSLFRFGIASRRPSAGQARAGQGNPTVVDSGDIEPQEVFLVLGDSSSSRLAAVKLACVRSHFHITQPEQPGG